MADENGQAPVGPVLSVNYIKTPQFREVACDGVVGGATSRSKIWMAFFAERFPLPRVIGYRGEPLANDASMMNVDETQPPLFLESRQGIVRNIEFGVYMDLEAAERVLKWLGDQVEQLKKS